MKKFAKPLCLITLTTLLLGGLTHNETTQQSKAFSHPFEAVVDDKPVGDLLGSINVQATSGGKFYLTLNPSADLTNGVYLRLRNNATSIQNIIINLDMNNFRVVVGSSVNITTFTNEGTATSTTSNADNSITLAAGFDGYVYIPKDSFIKNPNHRPNILPTYNFNFANVQKIVFEGTIVSLDIGDIFTSSATLFDGSEYLPEDALALWKNESGCTFTVNEGGIVPIPDFDYSTVTYVGDLKNAVEISASAAPTNLISTMHIVLPETLDLSTYDALTVHMKGSGSNFPFFFNFIDANGNVSQLPSKTGEDKVKWFSNDTISDLSFGGNDHSVMYRNNEGVMIVELDTLVAKTSSKADLSQIVKLEVGIATFYDYLFRAAFGDIGAVKVTDNVGAHTNLVDMEEHDFNDLYVLGDHPEYLNLDEITLPQACPWIGDVKILNSLNYKTDEALKKDVVWNPGDNACSYEKMDDGMFVHIGPFETGHQYGNYMCLQMADTGLYTDRSIWTREENAQKEYAKGITMYVKNLSRKEIGITLQFDEKTSVGTLERWCIVGYPAMYYAWDVNTNAEYTFFCKSDQFQIPVGFEGYVRIPFESYAVPQWCSSSVQGVDQILNIEQFAGTFMLTSDNTRFEDLEFFIKNIGVYFNETRKGTFFDDTHSIKANMGL